MRLVKSAIAGFALSAIGYAPLTAESIKNPSETVITAYQGSQSLFLEKYQLSIPSGNTKAISITSLPRTLNPDTIVLLPSDGLEVSQHQFRFPDNSSHNILSRLIGKTIGWAGINPATGKEAIRQGQLISIENGLIISFPQGIELNPPGYPVLSKLPVIQNGLIVDAMATTNNPKLTVGYMAGGLDWRTNYIIMVNEEDKIATFNGMMAINNHTGRNYKEAKIRLIAGHINMQAKQPMMRTEMAMASAAPMMADGVSEASSNDTHVYSLEGLHDIENGTMLSRPLINSRDLQIRKRYILEGYARGNPEPTRDAGQFMTPEIRFSFKNDKAAGLGKPLPAGIIRVMTQQDGAPMLLGEDRINHTPVGETVTLRTGRAFDVTANRKQTKFNPGSDRNNFEVGYDITLKNAKTTGVVVDVVERLPGKWKITAENLRHVKRDAATAVWSVSIPANSQVTLSYMMKTHR